MPTQNTHQSDINEIGLGYFLAGEQWFDPSAKAHFDAKKKLLTNEQVEMQMGRAQAMAHAVKGFLKQKFGQVMIAQIFWTARPNTMQKAIAETVIPGHLNVDHPKNPTDILIKLKSGEFIGVSAKSSANKSDIAFKNPSMGTIERALKVSWKPLVESRIAKVVKQYKLPESNEARATFVRKRSGLQAVTSAVGDEILETLRDQYFHKLNTLTQKNLRAFLLTEWYSSSGSLYPPYVKVTGIGTSVPFVAKIENPLQNPKLTALQSQKLTLERVGKVAVGVKAGGMRLLTMRWKWNGEKMCSPIKLSGEPWN